MTKNKKSTTIDYLGKHVIVCYDGIAYPGLVKDISCDDVYIECMKRVGKKANSFIWPKKNQR